MRKLIAMLTPLVPLPLWFLWFPDPFGFDADPFGFCYPDGGTKEQWLTNADGTGSHTTFGADGATGSFEVNNADGSSSTGGYNADGGSWAKVFNADGSGNQTTYYANGQLASEKITNAVLFGREARCEATANDAVFELRRVG